MEAQLQGKDFWHPDASRVKAEQLMQNGKHGCFIIRRSSNPGCLALSHKQGDGSFGHALIQWNGRGFSLEQTTQVYDTIEGLIKSLDLRLEDVKKNRPRPAHINGQPVLFQVEAITNYNAQTGEELTMGRGDVINVLQQTPGWHFGELDGKQGKFPAGLTKKVPGSEVAPGGGGGGGPPPMGGPGPMMGGGPPPMRGGPGRPPMGGGGMRGPPMGGGMRGPPMGGGGRGGPPMGGAPPPGRNFGGPPPGQFGGGPPMGGGGPPPIGTRPPMGGGGPPMGGGGPPPMGGGGFRGAPSPQPRGGGGGWNGGPPQGGGGPPPGGFRMPPPQGGGGFGGPPPPAPGRW